MSRLYIDFSGSKTSDYSVIVAADGGSDGVLRYSTKVRGINYGGVAYLGYAVSGQFMPSFRFGLRNIKSENTILSDEYVDYGTTKVVKNVVTAGIGIQGKMDSNWGYNVSWDHCFAGKDGSSHVTVDGNVMMPVVSQKHRGDRVVVALTYSF